jgi:hypothetical protein
VLGLTQLPLVHPGDAICHVALVGPKEMDAWRAYWEDNREENKGSRIPP